ncbi:MAG TPA: FAD-binding oxidoreductase [Armatimonadota bacterium]|jgi:glycolate oxidase FAD binding subunit
MTDIASALRLKLGALNVIDGKKTPFGARAAAFPANEAEAAECVAQAASVGAPVICAGGGSYVDALAPVRPDALLLSSARMAAIVEYHPEDMVITAEAGLPLAMLQDALRRKGQFLPVNPPEPQAATLGGIVASASTGTWRSAYGPVKDHVIEVQGVDAQSRVIRGGARVVKNVAGYDLPKLYTGSRGSLLFLTLLTFKVRPLPEAAAWLLFTAPTWRALHERLAVLAASDVRPNIIEVTRPDLTDTQERPSALITLEGSAESVQWQVTAASNALRGDGSVVGRVDDYASMPRSGDVEFTMRVLPTETYEMAEAVCQVLERGGVTYLPMEGRLTARLMAHPNTPELIALLRDAAEARGGTLTMERMPNAWSGHVSPFGAPRPDAALTRLVKARLDPHNTFSAQMPGW